MKRILAVLLIFLVCGCTVVRIDTDNIDTIVDVVLSKDNTLYNRIGRGYKYYVPRGVTYIDTDDLNDKLYSNGNYYYLYIDAISYYNGTEVDYEENSNVYYSRKISSDEGFNWSGYLEIEKVDDLYYIQFVYNYAKIETVVPKRDLNDAILNSAYILSTIQFNRDVIQLMLDDEYFTNREEKYEAFTKDEGKEDHFELQVDDD